MINMIIEHIKFTRRSISIIEHIYFLPITSVLLATMAPRWLRWSHTNSDCVCNLVEPTMTEWVALSSREGGDIGSMTMSVVSITDGNGGGKRWTMSIIDDDGEKRVMEGGCDNIGARWSMSVIVANKANIDQGIISGSCFDSKKS